MTDKPPAKPVKKPKPKQWRGKSVKSKARDKAVAAVYERARAKGIMI